MSYLFDGVNDTMTGTFTSTYADPVTLACFVKISAHPIAAQILLTFGNSSSSVDQAYTIRTDVTDNSWTCVSRDTTSAGAVLSPVNVDGAWAGVVGVFTNDSLRDIYVSSSTLTAQNTTAKAVADVLQFIRAGENFVSSQDLNARLAELATWNKALSLGEIDNYMAGVRASAIGPGNLIGYWPLDTNNATQPNWGIDTGGALSVVGAVFDADHPFVRLPVPGRRFYVMP